MDDLLDALKTLFIKLFQPFLATFVASLHAISSGKAISAAVQWDFAKAFEGWDKVFDKILRGLEDKAAQVSSYTACWMNAILMTSVTRRTGNLVCALRLVLLP